MYGNLAVRVTLPHYLIGRSVLLLCIIQVVGIIWSLIRRPQLRTRARPKMRMREPSIIRRARGRSFAVAESGALWFCTFVPSSVLAPSLCWWRCKR